MHDYGHTEAGLTACRMADSKSDKPLAHRLEADSGRKNMLWFCTI